MLAVRAALNAQARAGADIMSRVEVAVARKGQRTLQNLVRKQIGRLTQELVTAASGAGREIEERGRGWQYGDAPFVLRHRPGTAFALSV